MNTDAFIAARDFLFAHRTDHATAVREFRWPELSTVQLGARLLRRRWRSATSGRRCWIVGDDGRETEALVRGAVGALDRRSRITCARLGVRRGDRILLMLGNELALWEIDAGRDEARRGRHPGDHAARRPPTCAIASSAGGCGTWSPSGATRRSSTRSRRLHARSRRRRPAGLESLTMLRRRPMAFAPDGADARDRSAAALFHVRHDREAQARAPHPPELSGRTSVDDVLARPAAGRRPLEHQLAGMGEARVELLLRAVERRRTRIRPQLRAVPGARRSSTRSSAMALPRCARRPPCGAC